MMVDCNKTMRSFLILVSCLTLSSVTSFQSPRYARSLGQHGSTSLPMAATDGGAATKNKTPPTLTESTTWNLRFVLRNVATQSGKKVDEIFVVAGQFIEEPGYEPPQGSFVVEKAATTTSGEDDDSSSVDTTAVLKITKSRWQLSEDPNDRRDGLWIWGLFQEPLYPYLLLQLETEDISLSGGETIPALQLYAQINHAREDGAVVLQGADLKIRQMETIKADPFGAAQVEIFEEVSVGTLSIQPVS